MKIEVGFFDTLLAAWHIGFGFMIGVVCALAVVKGLGAIAHWIVG